MAKINKNEAQAACENARQAAVTLVDMITALKGSEFPEDKMHSYWQNIQDAITALDVSLQVVEPLVFPGTQYNAEEAP